MMESILSSETSVLTRATRCHIPEDGILHLRKASRFFYDKFFVLFPVNVRRSSPQNGLCFKKPQENVKMWGVSSSLLYKFSYFKVYAVFCDGRRNVFGSGTVLQAVRSSLRFPVRSLNLFILRISCRPPLLSNGQTSWLQTQRFRVRFPALPNFLSSSGSETGSTQPL
jgi:hypothetical protein